MEFKVSVDPNIIEMAQAIKALADLVPDHYYEEKEELIEKLSQLFLEMIRA